MIKAEIKMKWNEKAKLSNEDKKEILMATMVEICPPIGIKMLWGENIRLRGLLKKWGK